MRKLLLISHGQFAKGIANTLTLFLGENHPFDAISAYTDDTNVDEEISRYMAQLKDEDELIVFSDLNGGSVNQKMIPYLVRPNTHIIAGFNFPLLLSVSCLPEDAPLTKELIETWIEEARQGILYVNDAMNDIVMNDDDE